MTDWTRQFHVALAAAQPYEGSTGKLGRLEDRTDKFDAVQDASPEPSA